MPGLRRSRTHAGIVAIAFLKNQVTAAFGRPCSFPVVLGRADFGSASQLCERKDLTLRVFRISCANYYYKHSNSLINIMVAMGCG